MAKRDVNHNHITSKKVSKFAHAVFNQINDVDVDDRPQQPGCVDV